MKKVVFFTLFVVVHIGFFFLEINKQMQLVKESFTKQKNERIVAALEQKKQALTNELYSLQNKATVKKFAQKTLGLEPVGLAQIKHLDDTTSKEHSAQEQL